jgi:cytochrome c553
MNIFRFALVVGMALLAGNAGAANFAAGKSKAQVCIGCHGEDGNAQVPIFPKLAGQHVSYLAKQLQEFRSRQRLEQTMNAMAESLGDEDINDISEYFASFKVKRETVAASPLGEKVYRTGNAQTRVPACIGCHGPNGSGNPLAVYPHLAGQYSAFLVKALNDYKSGERNNDKNRIMRDIADRLSEEEIAAVADYISGLQ